MKEIKFRVWDIELKMFHYWEIIERCPTCLLKEYIREESQQYIGFKDKNGKETYEGDMVRCDNLIFKVYWREDYCGFELIRGNNITRSFMISQNDDYEVIGNIYENPEL